MGTNHDQLQVLTDLSIGKKVLGGLECDFVNEDRREVSLFFFSNQRIFCNSSYVPIQDGLFLFRQILPFAFAEYMAV